MIKTMSIKVLVVDDSLFMRTLISDMLNSDPQIEVVDTARNGAEALEKISRKKPDCVTLDLAMPGWDGLTTLNRIMEECPTPVIIISAYSKKDADITIKCLNAGAFGFILKPSGELSLDIDKVQQQLLEKIKAAYKADVGKIESVAHKKHKIFRRRPVLINKIIVIGASTGGPQALGVILAALPAEFPASIFIVQHMPTSFFTKSLAENLNRNCESEVKVIENNEIIKNSMVYLVPSGFSIKLKSFNTNDFIVNLIKEKFDILTPSVDSVMKAVARIYYEKAVGIILTGMGNDGVEGMRAIKESGGGTIVQDDSALIFGMPKEVIKAGYADDVLPLSEIAGAIEDIIGS